MAEQTPSPRPKRVVVVDADNPLVEVDGEFFWREDHDRIVADVQASAYQQGYQQGYRVGWSEADRSTAPQQVVYRYRPPLLVRLRRRMFWSVALVIFLVWTIYIVSQTVQQATGS